jgi:hypothetical protein
MPLNDHRNLSRLINELLYLQRVRVLIDTMHAVSDRVEQAGTHRMSTNYCIRYSLSTLLNKKSVLSLRNTALKIQSYANAFLM